MRIWLLLFVLAWLKLSAQRGVTAHNGMVVSARVEASNIGADIMKQGGNAFDAMIATQFALAVAYPYAGNISGGGFLVYRQATGETGSLDFREKAPLAATRDMFLDENGEVIPGKSTETALSVGVPGTIAGIFEVHAKFGTMSMEELIAPAIALARKGVVITGKDMAHLLAYQKEITKLNGDNTIYSGTFKIGDTIKYPVLAKTLERIAKNGRDEFYNGQTAKLLVTYLARQNGTMTLEDLSEYKPIWRKPIRFKFKEYSVISMPPPSSGGICLAQMLKMTEAFQLRKFGHNSLEYIQVLVEAERRSFADRNHFLGDPDFIKIPVNQLIENSYIKDRMKSFSFDAATPSSEVSHGEIHFSESDETTHFSIVDPFGNAVSVTTTLNGAYGSKLYCAELGFFLNNEMDDLSAKPGAPNFFGLTGSEANSIAASKRMLSSMTPTIVEKDGKLFMLLGSPGGSTIITSVLQTLLNVTEFNMGMQQAVDAPRFHHQWLPDEIVVEPGRLHRELLKSLEEKGYKINEKLAPVIGKVDAILRLANGTLEAGADKRGDDTAIGF